MLIKSAGKNLWVILSPATHWIWSWMEGFTEWENTEDFVGNRQILSSEFPTMIFSYDKL